MKIVLGVYAGLLLYAAYTDNKKKEISDFVSLGILILSLSKTGILFHLVGACLFTFPFLYLGIKTDGIGGGDIKFIFANGCYLGLRANYGGILLGFVFVLIRSALKKMKGSYNRKEEIALAPYLGAGYLVILAVQYIFH